MTSVAECYTRVKEICDAEPEMKLKQQCVEPECRRAYEKCARDISLRLDLYAETVIDKYEDHGIIEMNLATEAILEIIEKCRRYHEYYQTNKEQHATGVFPIVLWIVPTEERKQKMQESIRQVFSQWNFLLAILLHAISMTPSSGSFNILCLNLSKKHTFGQRILLILPHV